MPLANSGDLWQIQRKDTEVGGWKAVAYVRASTCSCSCPMYSPFLNLAVVKTAKVSELRSAIV